MAMHSWIQSLPARRLLSCALFAALLGATVPSAHAQPAKVEYRPEARAVFGDCKARVDGPHGRNYTCPGVTATIGWIPLPMDLSASEVLDMTRMGVASTIKGELSSEPATLSLAERMLPALQLAVSDPLSKKVQHTGHLVVDKQEGGAWMYLCLGSVISPLNAKSCAKKLAFFAKQGAPEPVDLKVPPPTLTPRFLSRELVIPEGCRVEQSTAIAGHIQCPGSGALAWYVISSVPRMDIWLKESAAAYRSQLPGDLQQRPVRCILEGAPADCVRLEDTGSDDAKVGMLIGVRTNEEQAVQVACIFVGRAKKLPPVCNGLLEELPDAAPDAGSASDAGTVPVPAPAPDAGSR
ncbi:hypothetical protein JY651_44430 [Pyxidicoccus parkwayensis]|uniref:Uncharacterized protein n=1 Tax=Pyxidicoccus parkwayensis TaxID=2813578 RepID=A0ABX7NTQ8_9BACT|nr:hypothetical protein [Pyxidicoccus parkwaysis]QSQ22113.1 hypothetical protein JY651_44430 [Pyxidicoccus parkwaysis]